jgi:hypothetical protein
MTNFKANQYQPTQSKKRDKSPRGFSGAKLMRKAAKGQLTLRGRC